MRGYQVGVVSTTPGKDLLTLPYLTTARPALLTRLIAENQSEYYLNKFSKDSKLVAELSYD